MAAASAATAARSLIARAPATAAAAAAAAASSAAPLLSIGLVADVQFAEAEDGASFDGVERRRYRRSLAHAAAAGRGFRRARCTFALQLGDAVDGLCARPERLSPPAGAPQGREALARVLAALGGAGEEEAEGAGAGAGGAGAVAAADAAGTAAPLPLPLLHVVGNHELLNFSRAELRALLPLPAASALDAAAAAASGLAPGSVALSPPPAAAAAAARLYYALALPGRWRLLVLDAYDVAVGRHGADADAAADAGHAEALALLRARNPNACAWGLPGAPPGDYFTGLAGAERRFVPFNGGLGAAQLAWLAGELESCAAAGASAVLALHVPAFDGARRSGRADGVATDADVHKCLLFNHEALLARCAASGCVALVLSGHLHEGAFGVDAAGAAHVTLESPLTHDAEGGAHAVLRVFEDRLELEGFGAVASRVVPARRRAGVGAGEGEGAGEGAAAGAGRGPL
jgi:manganese-dependent ADP-ribose/CDP-alcohol diphosphatase